MRQRHRPAGAACHPADVQAPTPAGRNEAENALEDEMRIILRDQVCWLA